MNHEQIERILSMPDDEAAKLLKDLRWTETELKNAAFDWMIKNAEQREDYEYCDKMHSLRIGLDRLQARLEKEGKL